MLYPAAFPTNVLSLLPAPSYPASCPTTTELKLDFQCLPALLPITTLSLPVEEEVANPRIALAPIATLLEPVM